MSNFFCTVATISAALQEDLWVEEVMEVLIIIQFKLLDINLNYLVFIHFLGGPGTHRYSPYPNYPNYGYGTARQQGAATGGYRGGGGGGYDDGYGGYGSYGADSGIAPTKVFCVFY